MLVNIEEIDWGLSAQSCMLRSTRYDIIVLQLGVMGSVMLDSYEQSTRAGAIRAGNALRVNSLATVQWVSCRHINSYNWYLDVVEVLQVWFWAVSGPS